MDSKRAGGVAIFGIITLVIIWGLLSFLPQTSSPQTSATNGQGAQATSATVSGQRIEVVHSVSGEMHTFSGSLETPTPCHMLEASTSAIYAAIPKVALALAIKAPASGTVCAQTVTKQEFSTSVSSTLSPKLSVTIDGVPAEVSLIEK